MKTLTHFFIMLLFFLPLACEKEDTVEIDPLPSVSMTDIEYGIHQRHIMDVYLPAGRTTSTPVIVLLHGGGFIAGDKSHFTSQAKELSSENFAILNMNYRLVDTTGLLKLPPDRRDSEVTIHDQLEDINAAIDYALDHAQEWQISQHSWGMAGHSAGATLALLYGYGEYNDDGQIKVVANWAGAISLAFNDESEFDQLDPRLKELYFRSVGVEPTNMNILHYMAVSPYWVLNNASSAPPTINIRPENNQVGNLPDNSAHEFTQFSELLEKKNIPHEYVVVEGADHGFGQAGNWDEVLSLTVSFFEKHIYE